MDVLVVLMHWGAEYCPQMNHLQEQTARQLTSLGVHLVIGCHPHVMQPYSYRDNQFVAYSLGNLLFAHEMTPEKFIVSKHTFQLNNNNPSPVTFFFLIPMLLT